jgi:hypothetical protein
MGKEESSWLFIVSVLMDSVRSFIVSLPGVVAADNGSNDAINAGERVKAFSLFIVNYI